MTSLDLEFTYDQFQFRQVMREGNVVLLEKSKPAHSCPGYEVVVVRRQPAQTIHGRNYPERESMPPSESWGMSGWTYSDLESASRKLRQLVYVNANPLPTPFSNDALETIGPLIEADPLSKCRY